MDNQQHNNISNTPSFWRGLVGGFLGFLLLSLLAAGFIVHHNDSERIRELETQNDSLREQEKKSVVDRRVSKQMEEIAYGQQVLSEERSREAIHQSEIAQAATLRSEAEREKALQAQAQAEASAQEAMESYQMAERRRQEANEQRRQAEHSKQVADTLNYISLGRTLGSQSYSIYRTGDTETGNMLAYASYRYTKDYGGNLYSSSVFPALMQSAGGRQSWSVHVGTISAIDFSPRDGRLLTVSTYGEMLLHEVRNGQLSTRQLLNNKNYCFRDCFASKQGKSYAISHTGHLIVASSGKTGTVWMENLTRPFYLSSLNDGRQLLVIGEQNLALLDIATDKVVTTRQLDFKIVSVGQRDQKLLLFDDKGRMHLVNDIDHLTVSQLPVRGVVTSFAIRGNDGLSAYGMADGTIYLVDRKGQTRRLVGHLSEVSKLKFQGDSRLYSSSYDGKLLLWMTDDNQSKPITLLQADSWLTDFTFDIGNDYIWTAETSGMITQYLISLPLIGQRLKNNVKRNFTREEWNYYVGKGIPYAEFVKSE